MQVLVDYCVEKKLYKALCGSRGSCTISDKLPKVRFEAASLGCEDYEFEEEIYLEVCGVRKKQAYPTSAARSLLISARG